MYKLKNLAVATVLVALGSKATADSWTLNVDSAVLTAAETTEAALAGDPKAGEKVFRKCKACHSLQEGKNGAGPSLHGILGASAATADGFRYSKTMKNSGIIWNAETLAAYLADPKGYLPGNKMAFRGLRKDADIENVIAYLAAES